MAMLSESRHAAVRAALATVGLDTLPKASAKLVAAVISMIVAVFAVGLWGYAIAGTSTAITIRNRLSHDFGPTQVSHIRQHAPRLIPIMIKFLGDIVPVQEHLRTRWTASQTRP